MDLKVIQGQLFDYFENEAGIDQSIEPDDSIVEGGVIDSFDIVALSIWLGEKYQIKISPLEVNLDNFDSVAKISSFISRKIN